MNDRTLQTVRTYAASPDLVWEAWSRSDHLDVWWGPDGFVTRTTSMDFRVGGAWVFTMEHPTHGSFPNRIRYRELVHAERRVYDHDAGEGAEADGFCTTVTFEREGAGTRVTLTAVLPTAEAYAAALAHGAAEGGRQTLGKLDVALTAAAATELVLERTLAAPLARVWSAWTEPVQLGKWWGPKGFAIEVATFELRPGGLFVYSMTPPGSSTPWWGRFHYREVVPMERIVWINSFSDAEGGVSRHPMAPEFPAEVHNTLTLRADGERTLLTLRGRPIRASAAEQALYQQFRASMEGGFAGTFAQLEALLAEG